MKQLKDNPHTPLLTGLGFKAEDRQSWTLWRLDEAGVPEAGTGAKAKARGAPRATLPWRLEALELAERKHGLSLHKVTLSLDRAQLVKNLGIVTRKYFGMRTDSEIATGTGGDGGTIWCVFEFHRPGSRESSREHAPTADGDLIPHGVGGFELRLSASGADVEAIVADFFGIGYLPANFASVPLRLVIDALGMRTYADAVGLEVKQSSIYEATLPSFDPGLAWLAERTGDVAAVAKLRELLAAARVTIPAGLVPAPQGYRVEAPFESTLAGQALASLSRVPLEVLESRERSARYGDLDLMIRQGKSGKALKVCADGLAADAGDLYLVRRLALLGLTGRKERTAGVTQGLQKALEREPRNKLLLSYGVGLALEDGDKSRTLAMLSRLGAEIMGTIDGADTLTAFDVVLPELLGDAWLAEDPRKAEECYQRVVQRRGDLPRVLRKIINIARTAGRSETEIAYLHRLAAVERRRVELAKIHLRLAELRRLHPLGRDEAIDLALKALGLDRSNDRAALLAAQLLVERTRPEEAIRLLDGLLRDNSLNLAARAKARLEAEVARIWRGPMRRPDLAEARFEQSLLYDGGDIGVLKDLEALYRANGRVQGLARLLEAQFEAFERAGDGEGLRHVYDELVALYRGSLAQPKRAFELYQRIVGTSAVDAGEIDKVLAWRDVDIDWRDLYARLLRRLPEIPAGERRAQYLSRLGEICRDKLADEAGALRHFMEALTAGWIDPASFVFVTETLARDREYAALARCYEARIEQVGVAERRRLVLELLAVPEVLSDPKRDALAVSAYVLDSASEKPVLQRFAHYRGIDDTDGIERMLQTILSEKGIGALQRQHWTRHAIEVLEGCIDERKYALMDAAFRLLLETSEDRVPILQDALAALKAGPEPQRLVPFVAMLLEAGFLPALEERLVVRLLAGLNRELALYHQLMSLKANQAEVAAQHARTAAAIYASRHGEEKATEAMLGRAFALVPCSEDDLKQLTRLVEQTQNWGVLAKVLQKQADLEDERQRKYALLERLGQVQWKKQKDFARARLTYVLAMKVAPVPAKIKLTLASIARDSGDAKHEQKALSDFILDPQCTLDTRAMTSTVERLLRLGEDPKFLQRAVQTYLDHAVLNGQYELGGRLSAVLLDNGIASLDLYKTAFRAAIAGRQQERAIDLWWRGLACVANKTSAKAFIAETRLILEKEERKSLLLDCFQAALANDIASRVGPKIIREVLILYGALLFDTDSKRRKALDIYVEAFATDPEDSRTWMPLYFLLLEFGAAEQRLLHLRDIIPKLDQDPRPLKAFPITIESLKVELKELEEQLKDRLPQLEAAAAARRNDVAARGEDGMAAPMARISGESGGFGGLPPIPAAKGPEARGPVTPEARQPAAREPAVRAPVANDPAPVAKAPVAKAPAAKAPVAKEPESKPEPKKHAAPIAVVPEPAEAPVVKAPEPGPTLGSPPLKLDARPESGGGGPEAGGLSIDLGSAPERVELGAPDATGLPFEISDGPSSLDIGADEGGMALDLGTPAAGGMSLDLGSMPSSLDLGGAPSSLDLGGMPSSLDLGGMPSSLDLGGMPSSLDLGGAPSSLDLGGAPSSLDLGGAPNSLDLGGAPGTLDLGGTPNSLDLGGAGTVDLGSGDAGSLPGLGGFDLGGLDAGGAALDLGGGLASGGGALPGLGAPTPRPTSNAQPPSLPHGFHLDAGTGHSLVDAVAGLGAMDMSGVSSVELAAAVDVPLEMPGGLPPVDLEPGSEGLPPPPPLDGVALEDDPGGTAVLSSNERPSHTMTGQDSAMGQSSGMSSVNGSPMEGAFGVAVGEGADDVGDWRAAVIKGDFNADLTNVLLKQAFASEIEKHLAIQSVAVVAGTCDRLANWHWRVWRNADEYGYPLSGKDRYPEGVSPPVLASSLHKLLITAAPLLVKVFRERFTIDYVAKRMNGSVAAIEKMRKPLSWTDGLLPKVGFNMYAQRIAERRYKAFNLPGLGREIFYEGGTRCIYLDEAHYRSAPPSHLFHRILGLLWSVRIHYFVPLALHPTKQIFPVLSELHQYFGLQGFSRIKTRLKARSNLSKHLAGMENTRALKDLFEKVGMPTEDAVGQLWDAMRVHMEVELDPGDFGLRSH